VPEPLDAEADEGAGRAVDDLLRDGRDERRLVVEDPGDQLGRAERGACRDHARERGVAVMTALAGVAVP
jgi:hypothetical protein